MMRESLMLSIMAIIALCLAVALTLWFELQDLLK